MAPKTIFLKSGREGEPLPKEAQAGAATIYPGMLIAYHATAGDVVVHPTAGGAASPMFAIEDSLQGQEIGDNYADNTRVQYVHCAPGDEVYAWLADGQTAVIGSLLASDGAGALNVITQDASDFEGSLVAIAIEALDLSASAVVAAARIKVVIL